jgi:hypothetical protein
MLQKTEVGTCSESTGKFACSGERWNAIPNVPRALLDQSYEFVSVLVWTTHIKMGGRLWTTSAGVSYSSERHDVTVAIEPVAVCATLLFFNF